MYSRNSIVSLADDRERGKVRVKAEPGPSKEFIEVVVLFSIAIDYTRAYYMNFEILVKFL